MPLESISAGSWSLLSALLAIALAWYVRDALVGLFVGIAGGAVVYGVFHPETVGVPPGLVDSSLGTVLGAILDITAIPDLVATSPLFADPWYVKRPTRAVRHRRTDGTRDPCRGDSRRIGSACQPGRLARRRSRELRSPERLRSASG